MLATTEQDGDCSWRRTERPTVVFGRERRASGAEFGGVVVHFQLKSGLLGYAAEGAWPLLSHNIRAQCLLQRRAEPLRGQNAG